MYEDFVRLEDLTLTWNKSIYKKCIFKWFISSIDSNAYRILNIMDEELNRTLSSPLATTQMTCRLKVNVIKMQ